MSCPSLGPKSFWTVQIVLDGYKLFWSGPNHFGQVQIRLLWTNFYNLDLSKMIWTRPKWIGPVQNNWYSTKMIWTHRRTRPKYIKTIKVPIETNHLNVKISKLTWKKWWDFWATWSAILTSTESRCWAKFSWVLFPWVSIWHDNFSWEVSTVYK